MEPTPFITDLKVTEQAPTKANAVIAGKVIADRFREGGQLLQDVTRLRAVMLACETALADLETEVTDEVEKYGKEGAGILGAKLEKTEAGVKYNYNATPRWVELKAQEDAIAAQRKDLEGRLKALKQPMAFTNMEDGDQYECYPAAKTSKTTYKVTLANQ